jgi:hypothetical protein
MLNRYATQSSVKSGYPVEVASTGQDELQITRQKSRSIYASDSDGLLNHAALWGSIGKWP